MRTIYIDLDYKCHVTNDGTMTAIETDFFDGKCDVYIEGYRFIPEDKSWTRKDGVVFEGKMITPWKLSNELDEVQRQYEVQLLEEYKSIIAEQDLMILDLQYNTLINEE